MQLNMENVLDCVPMLHFLHLLWVVLLLIAHLY
jgi:hypothetical protein